MKFQGQSTSKRLLRIRLAVRLVSRQVWKEGRKNKGKKAGCQDKENERDDTRHSSLKRWCHSISAAPGMRRKPAVGGRRRDRGRTGTLGVVLLERAHS